MAAQVLFVFGITLMGPMGPYYALAVAGRDEGFAALLALVPGPGVFLGFWLVGRSAARFGARRTLVACAAALVTALLSWLFVSFGNSSGRATGVLLVGPTPGRCAWPRPSSTRCIPNGACWLRDSPWKSPS